MTAKRRSRPGTIDRGRYRDRPGASPGTVTVDPQAPPPVLRVMAYGPDGFAERSLASAAAVREELARWPVVWLNVDGLGGEAVIREIGEIFGLHKLALEDVVHAHQRAKVDEYGATLYIVLRLPEPGERLDSEQLSLFLGRNFVVTFQERAGDSFEPVRERIRSGKGALRASGPDYLAYALLDAGIDSAFPVLEALGERLEDLEDELVVRPRRGTVAEIHGIKRDLLAVRRAVWPLREMLNALGRESTPLVAAETRLYLRDCYDHVVQIIELLETYREIASGLLDVYLSSLSNRMNEIMKVLTIIATIFIPLGFIASLYGMNFDTQASPWNMPELTWRLGYPFALGVMAAVAGGLLFWFRRRGWLGDGEGVTPARPPAPPRRGRPGGDDGRSPPPAGR